MSFTKDLAVWAENEHRVLWILINEFPDWNWEINNEKKWVDIISKSTWLTVECKFDRMVEKTWNIFIEIECNWKPSWIYKYSKMDVISYSYSNKTLLINREKLIKFIEENEHKLRLVNWWDWWRVSWYLIPIKDVEKIISRTIVNYDN